MRLQRQSNGQIITLDRSLELGAGGEACIYTVPHDNTLVAKVYHHPTDDHANKLATMLANPPLDPMAGTGHVSIAWPVDLLYTVDKRRHIAGFLMPRVTGMHPIVDFYNPGTRRKLCPLFNSLYLYRTARNLAAAICSLHEHGYVIGDINESNILVSETALVTLVDTDSFQVPHPHNGDVYRCPVGKPEFTPPELQGVKFSDIDRTPEHDRFGLAAIIFQLLMEGIHPFTGKFTSEGDPPPLAERILSGHFPYRRRWRSPYYPMPTAPPFEILPTKLRKLFVRCFKNGHKRPKARPDAETWGEALTKAENSLTSCSVNDQHRYGKHLRTCPWCERTVKLVGRDPFPSSETVKHNRHLQPIPPTQSPLPPAGNTATAPSKSSTTQASSGVTSTSLIQPARSTPRNRWAQVAIVFALLSFFPKVHFWAGLTSLILGKLGWRHAQAVGGRGKWSATAALCIGAAMLFSLFLHNDLFLSTPIPSQTLLESAIEKTQALIQILNDEHQIDDLKGNQSQLPSTVAELEAQYKSGLTLYRSQRYNEALAVFQRLTQSELPHRYVIGNSHYWAGKCYLKLEMPQKVLAEFQQVFPENSYKNQEALREMQRMRKSE